MLLNNDRINKKSREWKKKHRHDTAVDDFSIYVYKVELSLPKKEMPEGFLCNLQH